MEFKAIVAIPTKALCHCTVEVAKSAMEGQAYCMPREEKCALPEYAANEDRERMRVGKRIIWEAGTGAKKRDSCSTAPICNNLDQGEWIYHESLGD